MKEIFIKGISWGRTNALSSPTTPEKAFMMEFGMYPTTAQEYFIHFKEGFGYGYADPNNECSDNSLWKEYITYNNDVV